MKSAKCSALLFLSISLPLAAAQTAVKAPFQAAPPDAKLLRSATPFQNNNGMIPPGKQPLFKLNHAWPNELPPLSDMPWRKAIHNGVITTQNAAAYAEALKAAVAKNGRNLIMHYDSWNAAKAGWYNEPWLGSLREAIHGTYEAGEFGPSIFPDTGLDVTFNTHVVTYYDARAAYSLHRFWGDSAMKPDLRTAAAQFEEGAIVVKAAVFASEDAKRPLGWWEAMKGAQTWDMYVGIPQKDGKVTPPQVWPGYVAQFDIIVKDSQSSPDTGWVFMTLVYDAAAQGDIWDKMVPLGVQWGNDPQATAADMPLKENWINPAAPKYATQTLGWGGRLSGPNDGARNDIAVDGTAMTNAPDSSCMSCHSTSQWNVKAHRMDSFLLPSFATSDAPGFKLCGADGKPDQKNGAYICSPKPGSAQWMKWFSNRLGTVPMDAGSIATDFDEVFSFKALKLWWAATGPTGQPAPQLLRLPGHTRKFNQYTGAPLRTH